jgi:hypothetical protein
MSFDLLRQYRVNYGANYRAKVWTFYLTSQFLAPFMARFFGWRELSREGGIIQV